MNAHIKMRIFLILFGTGILIAGFILGLLYNSQKSVKTSFSVTSFEDCLKAGYQVNEKYPPECSTPDGQIFVQEISQFPMPSQTQGDEGVYCTQEAKECPNGTFVGRIGPKCEFAPCPSM